MYLIDKYIHELQHNLPPKKREKVSKKIRAMIDGMLPEEYGEQDVIQVLNDLGNPVIVASKFGIRRMSLIGPRYYELYCALLKMIIPLAMIVSFITMLADTLLVVNLNQLMTDNMMYLLGVGVARVFFISMLVFCVITIILSVLERMTTAKGSLPLPIGKWTVDELRTTQLVTVKKKIKSFQIFGRLMFTALWLTIYFSASNLLGLYEYVSGELNLVMPIFNQASLMSWWVPIMVIVIMDVALSLYKLFEGQWTKKMVLFQLGHETVSTAILVLLLTRSTIFNKEFVMYMAGIFNTTSAQFMNNCIFWFIVVSILLSIRTIYKGWKKAQLPQVYYTVSERPQFM